jgi:hypothetical protein
MLREITPPVVRQFLGHYEDSVFTVIPDGFGTYIVIFHDAYADAKIQELHISKEEVEQKFNIKL